MQLGFVGLGRMGSNMVTRLLQGGHSVVAWDVNADAVRAVAAAGARGAASLAELAGVLAPPRAVWVMVPAGEPTEKTVRELAGLLAAGDTIVDGGNSYYKDAIRRAAELAPRGLFYVDAGTSGGIWGSSSATASWSAGRRRPSPGSSPCSGRSRPPTATSTSGRAGPGTT